jgi:hypothetical protein
LHVHEIVLKEARAISRVGAESGDDGTADVIIVNDVVRPMRLIEPVARRPSSA